MDEKLFSVYAKTIVLDYVKEHLDKSDNVLIDDSDIYIVWMCKILQNNKAMLSTNLPDGILHTMGGKVNSILMLTKNLKIDA